MNAPPGRHDRVARILAALTAAAGLSVLVAFTGAVITWVRFQEAKLPADQAVAVAPNSALLAAGGVALVAFALIGGVAVLIAYFIDSCGLPKDQLIGVIVLGGIGIAGAALFTDAPWSARWTAVGVVAFVVVGAVVLAVLLGDMETAEWLKAKRPWLVVGGLAAAVVIALVLWVGLHERLAAVILLVAAALLIGAVWLATSKSGDVVRRLLLIVAILVLAGVLYLILDAWWVAAVLPLAVLLAIGVLIAADHSGNKFRWYGAAVFVAVIVFGAVMHTLRTLEDPRLQPMALLFTQEAGGSGQSGLFVAQGSDRVYVGLVERCHRNPRDLVLRPGSPKGGTGQIVSIPRDQIAAESVGTVTALNTALARGPALLDQLAKRSGTPPSAVPAVPCENEGVLDQKKRESKPVDVPDLAMRYRPVLKFDSEESWRPLNVDALLLETTRDGPAHRLCDGVQEDDLHCTPITSALQLSAEPNDAKAYVDLAGRELGGDDYASPQLGDCPKQDRDLKDCDSGPRSTIYYQALDANGHIYVDYWWFLRYNRFDKHDARELCRSAVTRDATCFDHEGDWEGVTLVLSKDAKQADRLEFVNYAAHEGVFRYRPVQITREHLRPIVYVANGSHAAYPLACPKECAQVNKLFGHALPEDNTDGKAPWGRNDDAECEAVAKCLEPLPTTSWGAFAGFWGSRKCDDAFASCTFGVPPRSPSQQRRFGSPWCYSGIGLRLTCDGKMPE
jgi:hypothetical protein